MPGGAPDATDGRAAEDVRAWLVELGLEQYHQALVEEGYDSMRAIDSLTDEDLTEMGVKRGHRRVLLTAKSPVVKEQVKEEPQWPAPPPPTCSGYTGGGKDDPIILSPQSAPPPAPHASSAPPHSRASQAAPASRRRPQASAATWSSWVGCVGECGPTAARRRN
eukprot:TRINITY_DN2937_c0_g2_i8.p1 TRINITY_DN2937_c0_g2~~TRINITY_DN2937_c0_g2_i8.p1  ORF type:complete len:164 (-),score=5.12 TRINITY_DN2937_c0_g2_i8:23-514(-)